MRNDTLYLRHNTTDPEHFDLYGKNIHGVPVFYGFVYCDALLALPNSVLTRLYDGEEVAVIFTPKEL